MRLPALSTCVAVAALVAASASNALAQSGDSSCVDLTADELTAKGEAFQQLASQGGCAVVPQAASVGIDCDTDLSSSDAAQGFSPGISGTLNDICPESCGACAPPAGSPGGDSAESDGADTAPTFISNATRLLHPTNSAGDAFGAATVITADHALVGSRCIEADCLIDTAWLYERQVDGTFGVATPLTQPDPQPDDRYGDVIALDGDSALVAKYNYDADNATTDSGAVVVFDRDPTTGEWSLTTTLAPDDLGPYAYFGLGMALRDGTAVIGAYNTPCPGVETDAAYLANMTFGDLEGVPEGQRCGRAYVYERDTATGEWALLQTLVASDASTDDRLGFGQTVENGTIVVAAPGYSSERGALYVFEKQADNGGEYVETAKILHSGGDQFHKFGEGSVALSGDTLAVGSSYGCCGDFHGWGREGEIVVLVRRGDAWVEQATLRAHDGHENNFFGYLTLLDGDVIVVLVRRGDAWVEQATLRAHDGHENNFFGYLTLLDGDVIATGVPGANREGGFAGSAHVFHRVCGEWSEVAVLTDPELAGGETFGSAIGLPGRDALVGADNDEVDAEGQGAAYLFAGLSAPANLCAECEQSYADLEAQFLARQSEMAAGNVDDPLEVSEAQRIVHGDGSADDAFGHGVAASDDGNTILVGAFGTNLFQGAAYVFERQDDSTFEEVAKLMASDGKAGDSFAGYVALDGDIAVISTHRQDAGPNASLVNTGAAYVFERTDAGEWVETAKIQPPGLEPFALMSGSGGIAVQGDTAVIGAYNQPCEGVPFNQTAHEISYDYYSEYNPDLEALDLACGIAYVYVRQEDGGGWAQEAVLRPADATGGDFFGHNTAIDGDLALVAAEGNQDGRGAVYVFARESLENGTVQWREEAKLTHSYGNEGSGFASWVALDISGDTAVVGSASEGLAHIYQRIDGAWYEQATFSPIGGVAANETFGTSAVISDNLVVIGSVKNIWEDDATGTAYAFRRNCGEWNLVATLSPPPSEPLGDEFGRAVDLSNGTVVVSAVYHATAKDGTDAPGHGAADVFDLPADVMAEDACATDCPTAVDAAPHTVEACEQRVANLQCVVDALAA